MQELLDKWNIKIDYKVLLSMWNEPTHQIVTMSKKVQISF